MATVSKTPTTANPQPTRRRVDRKITSTKKNPFNHVDKKIVDELLLVCGVIGSTENQGSDQSIPSSNFVPVEDCLNWLQDLQRVLRRDDDARRPISLLLGQWKVVSQKLLALVMNCRYDTPLVLTIVKILVILTKPMSSNAKKAARYAINAKKYKDNQEVIQQQLYLRDNGIAQAALLTEYKRAFVYHPSHRQNANNTNKEQRGLLSIFVSLLAEPLSRSGTARTDSDHLTIELVLHLIRNLLSAGGEPFMEDGNSSQKARDNAMLHQDLISLLEREMVLDILMILGQDMERRENKQYNLLMMEILHHMLKNQDPTLVARSAFQVKARESISPKSSIMSQLQKERIGLHSASSSRHSHFGGTLVLQKSDGQQRLINATATQAMASRAAASHQSNPRFFQMKNQVSNVDEKRKSKKHQYFLGSGHLALYTKRGVGNSSALYDTASPSSQRAQRVLHSFCMNFIEQCYGPLMKTLKEEFRRDSNRLEEEDKITFYRIVWFFSQWWRISRLERKANNMERKDDSDGAAIGPLIFTMDVFTYNLVLSSAESYFTHKMHSNLAQTVSLYTEMTHLLYAMYESKDHTEQIMALGLMDRLFYQSEPLDHLPKLLNRWTPSTFSREYMCDLIELIHVTLNMLEHNAKSCKKFQDPSHGRRRKGGADNKDAPKDIITVMKEKAADFEVSTYLARKIFSNQVVLMFTQLLSKYHVNAPHINDHIVSLFVRFCSFNLVKDDDSMLSMSVDQLLSKTVTLEPMLFNIPMIEVANTILNDSSYRSDETSLTVLSFVSTYVRHYARECRRNEMMHVETLFRHPLPYRFCELSANLYVTEELRMIAERDELVEAERTREVDTPQMKEKNNDPSSDEEEMEFDDSMFTGEGAAEKAGKKKKRRKKVSNRKTDSVMNELEDNQDEIQHKNAPNAPNQMEDSNEADRQDVNQDDDIDDWMQKKRFRKRKESPSENVMQVDDVLHKKPRKEGEDSTSDHDGDESIKSASDVAKENDTQQTRFRKKEHSDSEDDDDFGGHDSTNLPVKNTALFLDDDDDDDDE